MILKKKIFHRGEDRSSFATRLCIRNLPRATNETDLLRFLKDGTVGVTITDCKVLVKGKSCMAFVGVLTSEQGKALIDQYHRSYFRGTSRIVVEQAYRNQPKNTQEENQETGKKVFKSASNSLCKNRIEDPTTTNTLLTAATVSATSRHLKFWSNNDDMSALPAVDHTESVRSCSDSSYVSDEKRKEQIRHDVNPISNSRSFPPTQSDRDFLKSIQRGATDLEKEEENDIDEESSVEDRAIEDGSVGVVGTTPAQESAALLGESGEGKLTNRVFVRNLPFTSSEEDLRTLFEQNYCIVQDCHIPMTDQNRSKGFAFVTLANPNHVASVIKALDGCDFQGRILHLLPAYPKKDDTSADNDQYGLSFKKRKEQARRNQADGSDIGLSSSFVRSDAVVDTLASRMGFHKGDILSLRDGLSSGDAAVRVALGETIVIEENRKYLESKGVSLSPEDDDCIERSSTTLLVKNLPTDTTEEELMKVFGSISETVANSSTNPIIVGLVPSKTLAIVEYSHPNDAKTALRRLAYRRFKNIPLYIEWAPMLTRRQSHSTKDNEKPCHSRMAIDEEPGDLVSGLSSTLHVKNLNFTTTEKRLFDFFSTHSTDIRSVRIPQKIVPAKHDGNKKVNGVQSLSLGYGFVEFGSQESCQTVIKSLQRAVLDGHFLELNECASKLQNLSSLAPPAKPMPPKKLIVRNVPFQATRKDLLALFGSFGQLKNARLPKKYDGTHRGFAFIEFLTPKDALAAFKAFFNTHLYGRHLVIEWAMDEVDDQEQVRKITKRALSEPTGSPSPMTKKNPLSS